MSEFVPVCLVLEHSDQIESFWSLSEVNALILPNGDILVASAALVIVSVGVN